MKLIINADDLGANESHNVIIFELMAAKRITSATLMVNGEAFNSAVSSMGKFPHCSFGVHLNVTAFEPLTKHAQLRALRDAAEQVPNQIRFVSFTPSLVKAVHEEWRAQILAARRAGLSISHIDSHQHVHTIPALFLPLKAVQREFRIRKVRLSQNVYRYAPPCRLRMQKALWNAALRIMYATKVSDAFCDFATFLQTADRCCTRFRILEAMVHPGSPSLAEETGSLSLPWQSNIKHAVELVNYNQL